MNHVKKFLTLSIFDNHKIVEKRFIAKLCIKIIIDPNNYFLTTIPDCNYVHTEIFLNNNDVKMTIVRNLQ